MQLSACIVPHLVPSLAVLVLLFLNRFCVWDLVFDRTSVPKSVQFDCTRLFPLLDP